MISMTCDPRRETVRFVWRNNSFRFRCFWLRRRPKRNGHRRLRRPDRDLGKPAQAGRRGPALVGADEGGLEVPSRKKLRKGAVKPLKSLARANLCAGAEHRDASLAASNGQELDILDARERVVNTVHLESICPAGVPRPLPRPTAAPFHRGSRRRGFGRLRLGVSRCGRSAVRIWRWRCARRPQDQP